MSDKNSPQKPPRPSGQIGLKALRGILKRKSIIGALEVLHAEMGEVFRLPMPGFNPIMLVGAEANRLIANDWKHDLLWRMPNEPITILLHEGVLVTDREQHDTIRAPMVKPIMHRNMLQNYLEAMGASADSIMHTWQPHTNYDMLPEMRKIALLVLTSTLFDTDFSPDMERLWAGVIRAVRYISPNIWVLSRKFSYIGYNRELKKVDAYLYDLIAQKRAKESQGTDLIGTLIDMGWDDQLIRDQLVTMLIAGHDTSTASLAWTVYFLGKYPHIQEKVYAEIISVLGDSPPRHDQLSSLPYLSAVIDESLRLYPPIHLGSRFATKDLIYKGYKIKKGERILYSIYLSHRDPAYWKNPNDFIPERFLGDEKPKKSDYHYLPFGKGSRNCIGLAFADVEVKVVLARLLGAYRFELVKDDVRPFMGATLEPAPHVLMRVHKRK
ncbi:MAG: cytochrome P450 [Phototrophicales bacterium]|nr:cytochrome P450 [Phototrophicales bacterium]